VVFSLIWKMMRRAAALARQLPNTKHSFAQESNPYHG
jgi:hypothetical protein